MAGCSVFLFPYVHWPLPDAGPVGGCWPIAYQWASGGFSAEGIAPTEPLEGWLGVFVTVSYMFVLFLVVDFLGFYAHYLQHKVPLLWQFHKVHHSAEVMHPISNFREHPVDNFFYKILIGLGGGAVTGFTFRILGYQPNLPVILGIPVAMFLFNIAGYNLRHSHIWLRGPGVWSKVFPSPAHHHVHHSCHPDHLDKNFAFMFPFWDVLFGTYVMPDDNRDVKFGVTDKDNGQELNTCLKLYFLPFRDAWRLFQPKRRPVEFPNQAQPMNNESAE